MIPNGSDETVHITKRVKVTWRNKNPFVYDIRYMMMSSEAYVPGDMDFKTIEDFAREATPEGFCLKSIDEAGKIYQYDYNGDKVQ